ncbi:hypothetical protein PVK06_043223 [Gossypium arboreum]|uniref:Large ribosomal subunit protein uL2 C-terminal domain-containing protein n=1 Tax=Gossypium arboreum TaxID=29729 RepID=A0ABR0MNC1_GOSAR|nr:hypothetical protein PVK06_043223 [Gossypium arboreum]
MKEAALPTLSLKLVRLPYLPSGVEKLIDSRCRATIGIVYNPNHGALDHPHGGGEGRTKGGASVNAFVRRRLYTLSLK